MNADKYLKGECQEDAAKLFSVVPRDRRRRNWYELHDRKFQLNMRKNFFSVKVAEHRNRLPRGCGDTFPGDTKELSGNNRKQCALGDFA